MKNLRLLFGLLGAAPSLAYALGLGDIRLGSALNQPLVADIELVGAAGDELTQLRASLASREAFARYGVDRPAYLAAVTFKVGKDAAGNSVLEIRSPDPITEPFVTLLVEVSWPRGRLIREYTVLLDPPTFEQKASPTPAVEAPRTGVSASAATGAVVRAPVAESAPSAAAAPAATGGEYRVVRNDTLSRIAERSGAQGRADVNRLMIATFRANPEAFDGNINRLRNGALLRIPGAQDWQAMPIAETSHEVRRQMSEWRAARGGSEEARLRLVPPKDAGAAGPASAAGPATSGADARRVAQLEKELADSRRLLQLQSEELAKLQAAARAKPGAVLVAPPAAVKPTAVPAPAPAVAKPAAEVPPPAPAPVAKPAAKPAKAAAPAKGLLETLGDNQLYVSLAGAALLLAALVGFNVVRRRKVQADFDESLSPGRAEPEPALRMPKRGEAHRDTIVVEESLERTTEFAAAAPPRAAAPAPAAAPATPAKGALDDTLSSETAINLDQADPLAEADFHMAYGLYDQAADIVKLAIDREPDRRDLKHKLLEVYFVWGNKDAFLDVARDLGRTRDQAPAGDWDKVVIMGRQIAADDALFAGAAALTPTADVDLDLEAGGPQSIDLELLGDAAGDTGTVHLDLGHALAATEGGADTGEAPTLDPERFDLLMDGATSPGASGATTHVRRGAEAPTVEHPQLAARVAAEAPTVESPALAAQPGQTIREKLHSVARSERAPADATAELSLDDLDFEIDKLGSTSTSLDSLAATDHPADAPTMIAGLDPKSRDLLAAAGGALEPTRESPRLWATEEITALMPAAEATGVTAVNPVAATGGETGSAKTLARDDLDLDLGELARALENDTVEHRHRDEVHFSTDVFATGLYKAPNGGGVDLDVGSSLQEAHEPTVTERISVDELSMSELEPVTLSEVGTKLDLARAYMDMGDPDGARSILREVLSEGSASQKQEAQRLIDTLPG